MVQPMRHTQIQAAYAGRIVDRRRTSQPRQSITTARQPIKLHAPSFKPNQAKPSQAKPSRAKPSQYRPYTQRARSMSCGLRGICARPSQVEPDPSRSSQMEPRQVCFIAPSSYRERAIHAESALNELRPAQVQPEAIVEAAPAAIRRGCACGYSSRLRLRSSVEAAPEAIHQGCA